jgi:hypothetical protein
MKTNKQRIKTKQKLMKAKTNLFAATLLLAAANAALGAPSISYLRLGASPDCPHTYVSTANYNSFPTNVSVSPGALVYFTVSAIGTAPLSFQWRSNGQEVGATCDGVPACSYEYGCTHGYPGTELPPGDYSVVVTDGLGLSITSRVVTLSIDPTFIKVNAWSGSAGSMDAIVTDRNWSECGSWGDYDNDGYLDLFVGNGLDGHGDLSALYHNNGNGSFTRVFPQVFNTPIIESKAPCWGDYDNDGNLDLFVLALNSTATGPNGGALLYHNEGNGAFTRFNAGILITNANTFGAAVADYDGDGFLDLFVTTLDANASKQAFLFRNNGDGTFTPQNNSVPVTDIGSSVACAWGDYDNDGKIDLFVTGGRGSGAPQAPNRLYHNEGNGQFTRTTTGSIVTDVGHAGGCAWGDYDNDGYLDLFVVNILGETKFLYHNNGNGTFTRITSPIVIGGPAGWFDTGNAAASCAWGDYDNDGFLDLMMTDEGGTAPFVNFIYHNNGDGTFTKVTTGSPVGEFSDSFGCSWIDYDNDGFLDLFAIRGDQRGNALYHNNLPNTGNTNAWLTVKLVGTVSNRSAIGAKVRVKAFYRGQSRWQLRQITGGSGYSGHDELWPHFGLGDATNADTVRIEWPSGTVQEFQNVAPRQILTITEPPRLLASASNGVPQFSLKGGRNLQYEVDSSTNLSAWSSIGTFTITNLDGTALIVDTNPPALDHRFYRAVSH